MLEIGTELIDISSNRKATITDHNGSYHKIQYDLGKFVYYDEEYIAKFFKILEPQTFKIGTKLLNLKTKNKAKIVKIKNNLYYIYFDDLSLTLPYEKKEILKDFQIVLDKNYLLW